jgi:hypothetical protein
VLLLRSPLVLCGHTISGSPPQWHSPLVSASFCSLLRATGETHELRQSTYNASWVEVKLDLRQGHHRASPSQEPSHPWPRARASGNWVARAEEEEEVGSLCWFASAGGGGGWVRRRVRSPAPEEEEARPADASLFSFLGASLPELG